ncbi:MAG: glycine oxidase ThiO [Burkholderiales bacterium]
MRVTVIGAGVTGLVAALELAARGARVDIVERGTQLGAQACGWFAGGMLAPWCEQESAEPPVGRLGQRALDWWPRHFSETVCNGTLVVASARDHAELDHFGRHTERFERIGAERIAELEPDLAGRFRQALFFADEAHLDPRRAVAAMAARLGNMGVAIHFGVDATTVPIDADQVLDCRGFAARDTLDDLRGVRGEMLLVRTRDIKLSRPVRLLHPRMPLYVIPRADGLFMIGGTMIESDHGGPVTARSAMELLNGAYALHPAFGEAEIVEMGVGIRPAFADNLPRLVRRGRTWHVNGLYRHGFLLAPAMAHQAAQALFGTPFGESSCRSS